MTADSTAPEVDGISDLKAESAKRLAAHAAKHAAPATKVPEKTSTTGNAKSVEPGEGSKKTGTQSSKTAPASDSDADLSHIPEEFASLRDVAKADPKVADFLKKGILLERDYTQKRMADSEKEKKLAAREQAASLGEAILSDAEEMRLIYEHREAKAGRPVVRSESQGTQAAKFDFITATAEEIDAHLSQREAKVAARAKSEAMEEFVSRFVQPSEEKRAMATLVSDAYLKDGTYTADEINAAWDEMVLDTESVGGKVTKENAVGRLKRFLPAKATPNADASTNGHVAGASSLGRNGGRLSPLPPPEAIRADIPPAQWTTKQRAEVAMWRVSQRTGRKITAESLGIRL